MTVLRLGPMLANKIDPWKNFPLRTHCAPTAAHGFVTQTDERDASVASIPRVKNKKLNFTCIYFVSLSKKDDSFLN